MSGPAASVPLAQLLVAARTPRGREAPATRVDVLGHLDVGVACQREDRGSFRELLGADCDDVMPGPAVRARGVPMENDMVEGQPLATLVEGGQASRGLLQHGIDLQAAYVASVFVLAVMATMVTLRLTSCHACSF